MGADSKNHAFPAADLEPGGYLPRTEAGISNRKVPRPIGFPAGPELGHVPLLGRFFRSESSRIHQNRLYVFLTLVEVDGASRRN